jgi:hypothetical protein
MTAVETSNTESQTGLARISDVGTKKQVAGRACRRVARRRNCPLDCTNWLLQCFCAFDCDSWREARFRKRIVARVSSDTSLLIVSQGRFSNPFDNIHKLSRFLLSRIHQSPEMTVDKFKTHGVCIL